MLVRIPVRNHLLKFLKGKVKTDKLEIRHFSQIEMFEEQSEIIYIQRELSRTLYPFLNTQYKWSSDQLNGQGKFSMIGLNLKDYLVNTRRIYISIKGVMKFNETLDDLLMKELLVLIDKSIADKKRLNKTILEFMSVYEIDEDDIRFDSLKKRCWRERSRISEKIFLENNLKGTGAVLDLSFQDKLIDS